MSVPPVRRLLLTVSLLAATAVLTGCEQVEVIRSAPVAVVYDTKAGNSPLAAADAASLQEALRVRAQVWSIRIDTKPASAGNVDVKSAKAVQGGRAKFTAFAMTLTATSQATVEGFSSRGAGGEQQYCESLIQAVARAGYTNLRDIRVEVYFNGSHHSTLTWSAATSFVYKVLDGRP